MKNKNMKNKQFLRRMLVLALPIALQNLLSSCGYLVDTAMVVRLGNTATSAIGVAGRWSFLMNIAAFGVCSGSAVLIAQSWGAGDHRTIRRSAGLALAAVTGVSGIYILLGLLCPEGLMGVFTDEAAVIAAGADYLRIACFAALFSGIALVISTAMRSTEDVRTPFVASTAGVLLNILLNYLLIYGHMGLPRMELAGAALATVLAMAAQMCILLVLSRRKKSVFLREPAQLLAWDKAFVKKYIRVAAPVLCNEILWAVGTNIYSVILARQGSENYAAYTVYNSIHEIFFVFSVGLCSACAIMVGKTIGEGKNDLAYEMAKTNMEAITLMSVALGAVQILLRYPILSLMHLETQGAVETAASLLVIHGLLMPVINLPYLAVVGIFRAGGDATYGFFIDTFSVYFMGIPTLACMAYLTKASFPAMVAGMFLGEYCLKTILCILHFRSRKWIRNLM